ncbi:serine hydrolase [Geodermatophilus amargosae]|uniref:serine hydrolase n=1 Tax=Geodermatophilus amargosae TaxID=1296565 RepID=UPI0034DFF456
MRRPLAVLVTLPLVLAACSAGEAAGDAAAASSAASSSDCPAPPAADPTTPDGWLGWLAEHRDDVAVVVRSGDRAVVEHRAGEPQPVASALKVVHLAAWATAVQEGRPALDERVRVGDWERWYLPGTDGGAHVAALDRLGVAHDGVRALDPGAEVALSDVVSAMVRESDNAAPDLLRDLLGEEALAAAAAGAGLDGAPPTFLGTFLRLVEPSGAGARAGADADADADAAARRYADDPAEAARVQALLLPGPDAQVTWAETTPAVPAAGLADLHLALADGDPPAARAQLEWQPPPEGLAGLGFKGGSLPGVLAEAITVRDEDGTTSVGVLLVRGMAAEDWVATLSAGLPHQQLLVGALTDEATAGRLACALA